MSKAATPSDYDELTKVKIWLILDKMFVCGDSEVIKECVEMEFYSSETIKNVTREVVKNFNDILTDKNLNIKLTEEDYSEYGLSEYKTYAKIEEEVSSKLSTKSSVEESNIFDSYMKLWETDTREFVLVYSPKCVRIGFKNDKDGVCKACAIY